jgi:hypothetical protein
MRTRIVASDKIILLIIIIRGGGGIREIIRKGFNVVEKNSTYINHGEEVPYSIAFAP